MPQMLSTKVEGSKGEGEHWTGCCTCAGTSSPGRELLSIAHAGRSAAGLPQAQWIQPADPVHAPYVSMILCHPMCHDFCRPQANAHVFHHIVCMMQSGFWCSHVHLLMSKCHKSAQRSLSRHIQKDKTSSCNAHPEVMFREKRTLTGWRG